MHRRGACGQTVLSTCCESTHFGFQQPRHTPVTKSAQKPCAGHIAGTRARNNMAKITIVTDAWHPQVNGVVRSLDSTIEEMRRLGHEIMLVTPDRFRNIPLPSYPEIRITLTRYKTVAAEIDKFQPSLRAHSHGRPARLLRPQMVPEERHAVLDQLSHPLSGICLGAHPAAEEHALRHRPPFPQCRQSLHGRDPEPGERTLRTRLPQPQALDTRHRPHTLPAASAGGKALRPQASDLHAGQPGRSREEHPGVPGA
jgi:hypothetical protein